MWWNLTILRLVGCGDREPETSSETWRERSDRKSFQDSPIDTGSGVSERVCADSR